MSINVTVTGNPVNIRKGKMVCIDPNYEKQEFEKRRLMRLEQVRQQSKDIAENVRNKVRKEKNKQMKHIEEEGEEKLKNWQNRRLLHLQNQYKDALEEIGKGHKEAKDLADENEIMIEQETRNNIISQQRGQEAVDRLQVEKNEQSIKKSMPIQRKKMVREAENSRSAILTSLKNISQKSKSPTKKRKKKTSANISISIPGSETTTSEESLDESSATEGNGHEKSSVESSCMCTEGSEELRIPLNLEGTERKGSEFSATQPYRNSTSQTNTQNIKLNTMEEETNRELSPTKYRNPPQDRIKSTSKMSSYSKEGQREMCAPLKNMSSCTREQRQRDLSPLLDTRISDRIKRRDVMASQVDYCDMAAEINHIPLIESNKNIRNSIDSRFARATVPEYMASSQTRCFCGGRKSRVNFYDEVRRHDDAPLGHSFCPCRSRASHEQDIFYSQDRRRDIDTSLEYEHLREAQSGKVLPKKQLSSKTDLAANRKSTQTEEQLKAAQNIPIKPPIRVRDVPLEDKSIQASTQSLLDNVDSTKVSHYDHRHRFSQPKLIPSASRVDKITADSLEVVPDLTSEIEWYQKMEQRDKEAQIRGQKALEKEKIRRDYQELMKKLPILQKKERIYEIGMDKPEYHMSEERLKEKEKQQQTKMENAFNKMFPNLKPAVITLPRINPATKSQQQTVAQKVLEPTETINVAEWDIPCNENKMFTADEVQEIVDSYVSQDPKVRQEKLKELLIGLKLQKAQLMEEMKRLPINDSVNELINDLKSFNDDDDNGRRTRRRNKQKETKRKRHECDFDSTLSSTSSTNTKETDERRRERRCYGGSKRSPRKKAKMKSVRKVLILQNTSTQTTPKADKESVKEDVNALEKSPKNKICEKQHQVTSCDCDDKENNDKTSSEEVCHISIKLNEDKTPEIIVKSNKEQPDNKTHQIPLLSPKKSSHYKSVAVGPDGENERFTTPKKLSLKHISKDILERIKSDKIPKKDKVPQKKPSSATADKKSKSWRDQLTKNSISTSSTSYWSPPDFEKSKHKAHSSTKNSSSFYNLRQKPHQKNLSLLSESEENTCQQKETDNDKDILSYVKRLLNMSRGSIEQLNVSSVSNVPTPSQSVIEVDTNIPPLPSLQNLIKLFNLNNIDLVKELSCSPDQTAATLHYNTSVSASDKEGDYEKSSSVIANEPSPMVPEKEERSSSQKKTSILAQYTDITDSCSKRIAALAEMIQRLRDEKVEMLHNPPVALNRDHSTSYLELPESGQNSSKHSSSSNNSLEEEDIYRKLIEIDHSLVDKLQKYPTIDKHGQVDKTEASNNTNEEFWARLQRLKETDKNQFSVVQSTNKTTEESSQVFVPFLSDIPKLPKFEPSAIMISNSNNHKKPPPSKGLMVARKFNGNISLIPHELSTIVEADSQISTKIGGSALPSPKLSMPEAKDTQNIEEVTVSPDSGKVVTVCKDDTCKALNSNKFTTSPPPLLLDSSPQQGDETKCNGSSKLTSSSSTEDVETIEAMLRSIGMAWAIPTLYKTQEALALTSSSSSLDLNAKKQSHNESSESEISLRDFLKKHIWSKISSSTFKSDEDGISPTDIVGEFADMSEINANEKERQRTSTPITTSKSTQKSKDSLRDGVFSGDSDISSVRNDSHSRSK